MSLLIVLNYPPGLQELDRKAVQYNGFQANEKLKV